MEICDRLDEAVGGPSSRYDDQPCREQSLRARWRELYRMALTGWGSFADRVADADIDDFIDDHRVAGQHWMRMREHWRAFIDALVESCERRGWLATGGSLLLPIDDLDLTPHLGMDVLQALRHLQHPRLITLVTGDSHHLRQVVARQLLARELGDSRASDLALSRAEDDTRALAEAYIGKVLPIGTRLNPPAFGPAEAFRMATHRWRGADGGAWRDAEQADVDAWLGQAYRELKGEGADPGERFEAVEPVPGAPLLAEGFRIRDLAHALDGAAGERGTPQLAAALLMRLLDAFRVEREGRLSDRTFAQDLEGTYHSYEAEMVPLDVRWTDGVGVARSVGLCLHGEAHRLTLGSLARLRLRL